MWARSVRLLLAAVVSVTAFAMTGAGAAEQLRIDTIETLDHPRVKMTLTAPTGLAGETLTADNFTVTENGTKVPFDVVALPTDELNVTLLVDTSGSMRGGAMASAKGAARAFTVSLPSSVPVRLIGFGTEPDVKTPLTGNDDVLARAISNLEATGETALYDAVLSAVAQEEKATKARRALVVLSDGGDTASEATLREAATALKARTLDLYVVSLETTESDSRALRTIAKASGGRVVSASDPSALEGVFRQVASQLVNRYELSFESTGGGTTELDVSLTAGGITAASKRLIDLPPAAIDNPAAKPSPAPIPERRKGTVAQPAALERDWVLPLGAGVMFAGLAVLLGLVLSGKPKSNLLARRRRPADIGKLSGLSGAASAAAERTLGRRGLVAPLNRRLEQAGIPLRAGEYVLAVVAAAVVVFFVGTVFTSLLGGLALFGVTVMASRILLVSLAERRQAAFAEQLPDTLQILAGSMRAGYGLLQAVDAVSRDADAPTSEEFRRVVVETRLGRDLTQCLEAMAVRLDDQDLDWVVQAIAIHRDVGGDLSEVLDRVGDTIRERSQVKGQIKALSAEGRISAWILLALPFVAAGGIMVLSPEYGSAMYTTRAGLSMLGVGAVLMVIGSLWIRRIIRLKF